MALTDNLLAFYKLDNTNDSSGNGNTLTDNGNVSFASGKIGNAAVFDGTNYLTASFSSFGPIGTGDFTASVWVKFNNLDSNNPHIIAFDSGFALGVYQLESGTRIDVNVAGVGGMSNATTEQSIIGNWTHFLIQRISGVVYHYVNGALTTGGDGSYSGDVDLTGTEFYIGCHPGPILNVDGQIDAVGIWNRALSESEVAALYNSGTGLELPAAPAVKNGWIDNIYWINDVATSLDQNGDGTWVGKLYENGSLFSGTKYELTFVDGVAQPAQIVTVTGNNIPVAFGLNESEEPLVQLVFASITSAGETTVEQIVPTVLPAGIPPQYTVAQTLLAYTINTTATFEGTIDVDFILPSNISQTVFDRCKAYHVKTNGTTEEMTRVASDFATKKITVAITSFSSFLFLDEPPQQSNKSVKVVGKSKFVGKAKFA